MPTRQNTKRPRKLGDILEEEELLPAKRKLTRSTKDDYPGLESPKLPPHPIPGSDVIDLDPEYDQKRFRPRTDGFPRFVDGSIYIQVARLDNRYNYAFNKSDLARVSEWFANESERAMEDSDPKRTAELMRKSGYKVRFELRQRKEFPTWVLKRSCLTKVKASVEQLPYDSPPPIHAMLRVQKEASVHACSKELVKKAVESGAVSNHRAEGNHLCHATGVILPQLDGTVDTPPHQKRFAIESQNLLPTKLDEKSESSSKTPSEFPSPLCVGSNTESSMMDIDQPHSSSTSQAMEENADMRDVNPMLPLPMVGIASNIDLRMSPQHTPSLEIDDKQIKIEKYGQSVEESKVQETGTKTTLNEEPLGVEGLLMERLDADMQVTEKHEAKKYLIEEQKFPETDTQLLEAQEVKKPDLSESSQNENTESVAMVNRAINECVAEALDSDSFLVQEEPRIETDPSTHMGDKTVVQEELRQQQVIREHEIENYTKNAPMADATEVEDFYMLKLSQRFSPEKLGEPLGSSIIESPSSQVEWPKQPSTQNLVSSQVTQPIAVDQQPLREVIASSPVEHIEPAQKINTPCGVPFEICEVYNNLFLLLHDMSPNIDSRSINNAFEHIQSLVDIAAFYYCLQKVRTYLSNHLLNFGRELFEAISQAPSRWLQLSILLECAPIFKEAITHIVGQYQTWSKKEHHMSGCPADIENLIKRKVAELESLKVEINKELFIGTINVNGKNLSFFNIDKSNYDSWCIAHAWRDWFCNALTIISKNGKQNIGKVYRLMAKGTEAYLPSIRAYEILLKFKGGGFSFQDLKDLEEDMEVMKGFAKMKVKPLVVNHSMLDVEAAGIDYLTCTKVENDELPWIRGGGG